MTQKEIAIIKKRAKECLHSVGLNIPMVKMEIILFMPSRDGYGIRLVDIRTRKEYFCICEPYGITPYKVYVYDEETGKPHLYKKGEIEND